MKSIEIHFGHILMTLGIMGVMGSVALMLDHVSIADAVRTMLTSAGTLALLYFVSRIK